MLGLPPDASPADVKRAYRLLAKQHHPDAGDGSVARFLEIQAAYETLVGQDLRADGGRAGAARPSGRRPAQQGPRPAGARRSSAERPGDPGAPPPPGTEWARRPRDAGGWSAAGAAGASERVRRGRGSRTASLGSTTYDEAGEPGEPTWEGAAWYGPASGTYWTLNPKEYADPRKHGPEYRARWAARPGGAAAPTSAPPGTEPLPGTAASRSGRAARSRVAPAPTLRRSPGVGNPAWPRPLERFVLGALGWLPFGTLLAAAVGLPGGLIATLPLQVAGFVGMLWAPRLAWVSAGGLAAVLGFAIPGIAALAAMGITVRPGGPAPAGVIVLAAFVWCGGAAIAARGRMVAQPWRARR